MQYPSSLFNLTAPQAVCAGAASFASHTLNHKDAVVKVVFIFFSKNCKESD